VSDSKFRRLRVLHLVGGDNQTAPNALLLPLLTRGDRQRIESHVVNFVRSSAQFAVVRQSGVPVHELPLSDKQFSPGSLLELKTLIQKTQPDVIHAWGSSAHVAAMMLSSGKQSPPVVWSIARTTPLAANAGLIDKFMFGRNKSYAPKTDRIVYASAAAAAQHRRAGLPEDIGMVISPGVDADRFRPDPAARQRVRQQLELPPDAVVVGMYAPFQPEFDHATLLKAMGELIKNNQHLYCVLAGRAIVRGNAALMAMVGGGTLGTRTRLIGEWSDLGALFNACDVVCSSAKTDVARLSLAMSMLCGVMCVATGVGAQGEVIGNFGAAVEPGSPDAIGKGIRRILEMPADRHVFMAREARKHAWQNFNIARSIDRYHEMYIELATGEAVKLAADKPDPIPDAQIIARPTPAPVAAKPVEEAPPAPTPLAVEAPVAPAKPDTLAADLDALLSKQGDALAKGPDAGVKHSTQENVMEWSEDDAKLIEGVMVEADPATIKVIDAKPMPVRSSIKAAEAKLAETKSPEQKTAEQRLLEARRAELRRAESNMMRKPAAPPPKPADQKPVDARPELKLVETKPVDSKTADAQSTETAPVELNSAASS
jgi:glycosyltransferase involved in cell wall biosynthesis